MRIRSVSIPASVVAGLILAGCGSQAAASGSSSTQSVVSVVISNFKFVPSIVRVKSGEDIKITNEDSVGHTFTATNHGFDTGTIPPGQSVIIQAPKLTGTVPLSDPYLCTIHQFMTGTLIVSP